MAESTRQRGGRLQIMLDPEELDAVDAELVVSLDRCRL
jgi:hypothetical protein